MGDKGDDLIEADQRIKALEADNAALRERCEFEVVGIWCCRICFASDIDTGGVRHLDACPLAQPHPGAALLAERDELRKNNLRLLGRLKDVKDQRDAAEKHQDVLSERLAKLEFGRNDMIEAHGIVADMGHIAKAQCFDDVVRRAKELRDALKEAE